MFSSKKLMFASGNSSGGFLYSWGRVTGSGQQADAENYPTRLGNDLWISASKGYYHALAVKSDFTLWSWGQSTQGALGLGSLVSTSIPAKVGSGWKFASAGSEHSLGIKLDGTLWGWGKNGENQLGDGTFIRKNAPVQIGSDTWNFVSSGNIHSLGIRSDGTLWAWGFNSKGQIGTGAGSNTYYSQPVQISSERWIAASANGGSTGGILHHHSLAIKEDGTLWAWGDNRAGQLGPIGSQSLPGNLSLSPMRVGQDTWRMVKAGPAHSVGLRSDGTAWFWGSYGYFNQIDNTDSNYIGGMYRIGGEGEVFEYVDESLLIRSDGKLCSYCVPSNNVRCENIIVEYTPPSPEGWFSVDTGGQSSPQAWDPNSGQMVGHIGVVRPYSPT